MSYTRSFRSNEYLRLTDFNQAYIIENHGMQCGFCISGMALIANSLLDETKDPIEEEIKGRIGDNLCRCGNYTNLVESISEAEEKMEK